MGKRRAGTVPEGRSRPRPREIQNPDFFAIFYDVIKGHVQSA